MQRIALILALLLIASPAWAAPSVSGVSGTVSHEGTITVSGSDFGSKSPAAPLIWDDAEGRTVDTPSAVVSEGGWTQALPSAASVKAWWRMQYRESGWQGVNDYGRGEQYLVGGHWNNWSEQASNVALTKSAGSTQDRWYATWYVRTKFPEIDSLYIDHGNYKEYAFQANDTIYGSGGTFTYCATSAEYQDVCDGGTYSPSHQTSFCDGSDTPNALNPKRTHHNDWKHEEWMMENEPGSLRYYSRDDTGVQTVFDYTCSGAERLVSFNVRSFSVGGFHKRSDNVDVGEPTVRNLTDTYWHSWVQSSVSANHYYLLLANVTNDTNPDIDQKPEQLWINGSSRTEGDGSQAGGLDENEWDYGDFDSLGFNTVYVRLTGNADPDSLNSTPGYVHIRHLSGSSQRQEPNAWRYFDDVYMDTTYSRVVLANNATFASATIVEPQIPSAWASGEITATVNLGRLTGSTAYLFVFDADNTANATGYAVTLSDGEAANGTMTLGSGGSMTLGSGGTITLQ